MPVSPDDRFAGLINSSAERGGWVPGDVFESDTEGDEEPVEPRRIRMPILVALALATVAVLVIAFFLFKPVQEHAASQEQVGPSASGQTQSGPGQAPSGPGQPQPEAASEAQGTPPGKLVVHVTGQVHKPSVVSLASGSRVQDAVEAAGGLKDQADAEAINLARVLQDGEQIHIPARGEESGTGGADAARADADAGASGASGGQDRGTTSGTNSGSTAGSDSGGEGSDTTEGTSDANAGGKVDLNTADLTSLQTLPGVGPVTAEAIMDHREEQPFGSVEDLLLVQGIGPKTFESLKDLVSVG